MNTKITEKCEIGTPNPLTNRMADGLSRHSLMLCALVLLVASNGFSQSLQSTNGVVITAFTPTPVLKDYSIYATDSIFFNDHSTTATKGYIGSGGGISFKSNVSVQGPYLTAKRNFSIGGNGVSIRSKLSIGNDFIVLGDKSADSVIQVGRDFVLNSNNQKFAKNVWVGEDLNITDNSNNNEFQSEVHARQSVVKKTSNRFTGGFFPASTTTTATGLNAGELRAVSAFPNPMPVPDPVVLGASSLPGSSITGLLPSGSRGSQPDVIVTNSSTNGTTKVFECSRSSLGALEGACKGDTLQPGYYGNLELGRDAAGLKLLLAEGFYFFKSIKSVQSNSSIIAAQPNGKRTFLFAEGDISLSNSGDFIGPSGAVNATGYGSGPNQFLGGTMMVLSWGKVNLGKVSTVWATISAPGLDGNTVSPSSNSPGDVIVENIKIFGQIFARRVLGSSNVTTMGAGEYIPFDPEVPVITIDKLNPITIREEAKSAPATENIGGVNWFYKDTVVNITINRVNAYDVSVDWAVEDVTAKRWNTFVAPAPPNYAARVNGANVASGTIAQNTALLIPKGSTSVPLALRIYSNAVFQGSLQFNIVLTNPRNAKFASAATQDVTPVTILDDDKRPTLRITDVTKNEGNVGKTPFVFTVSLVDSVTGAPLSATDNLAAVSFDWKTVAGANATENVSYDKVVSSAVIPAGSSSVTLTVQVNGNTLYEPNKLFQVQLSNTQNVSTTSSQVDLVGQGTIVNDDNFPVISVAPASANEGTSLSFQVSLSGVASQDVCFDWTTRNQNPVSAVAGVNYTASNGTNVCIPKGSTTRNLVVPTLNDNTFTGNLTLDLGLTPRSGSSNTAAMTAVGTIVDQQSQPTVSFALIGQTVTENVGTATVQVVLSNKSSRAVTVVVNPGTVTAPTVAASTADYNLVTPFTVTIPAGSTSGTLSVGIVEDALNEDSEVLRLVLSAPTNATLGAQAQHDLQITDNDNLPTVGFATVTSAAAEATTTRSFVVQLSQASGRTVTVNWATKDTGTYPATGGTASTAGVDYLSASGVLTFAPGVTSQTISVTTLTDTRNEFAETYRVRLTTPVNALLGTIPAHVDTIKDDDAVPQVGFVIDASSIAEAGGTATLQVRLSAVSGKPVAVNFATSNGTAAAGQDYTAKSGTVNFAPGEQLKTVTVSITDDLLDENDELFRVTLSSPSNATLGVASHGVTILDNDAAPVLSIVDTTVDETEANQATTLSVALSAISAKAVVVTYSFTPSTALLTGDFVATAGTVTIPAGQRTAKIPFTIVGDALHELTETFALNVSADLATVPDPMAVVTIRDNDAAPRISIGDVSVTEPAAGAKSLATFTVTLDRASAVAVSLNWKTLEGTALAGVNFRDSSGTLDIPALSTTKTFSVEVLNDNKFSANKQFSVQLSLLTAIADAVLADETGVATIVNADAAPVVQFSKATSSVQENTGVIGVDVVLTQASELPVSVSFKSIDGTALAGKDFTTASGTVSFAAGETRKSISVQIAKDALDEADETFVLELSNAAGASLGLKTHTVTILDDDAAPNLSVSDTTITETQTTIATGVSVRLNVPSGRNVVVNYSFQNGTALAGQDYTATSGSVTIPAGQTAVRIPFSVLGDALYELSEDFSVTVTATNATVIRNKGTQTIVDNDVAPELSVGDVTVTEPTSGNSALATFTLTLSSASRLPVTVSLQTADSTALRGVNYKDTTGTVVIPAGSTTATFSVRVLNDNRNSISKYFKLLANAVGATVVDPTGVGTILDSDAPPTILINNVSVTEALTGTVDATFEVRLSQRSDKNISVRVATADSTAVTPADYQALTTTLTFAPGDSAKYVTVKVKSDNVFEATEYFKLALSSVVNANLLAGTRGVATILDGNGDPRITIDSLGGVPEQDTVVYLRVRLSGPSAEPITVTWHNFPGNAQPGADYVAASGTLTFAPGKVVDSIALRILEDAVKEGAESLYVQLDRITSVVVGATGPVISAGLGQVRILDDGDQPSVSIAKSPDVVEGEAARFTVRLGNPIQDTAKVIWKTQDKSAVGGAFDGLTTDFAKFTRDTLVFLPGQTSLVISVPTWKDSVYEASEEFSVRLVSSLFAVVQDSVGTATLLEEGTLPQVSWLTSDTTLSESSPAVRLVATLSRRSAVDLVLPVVIDPLSTTASTDVMVASSTIRFVALKDTASLLIDPIADGIDELDENLLLNLRLVSGVQAGARMQLNALITDNDAMPIASFETLSQSVSEAVGTVRVRVLLDRPSSQNVSVAYAVAGTATVDEDHNLLAGTVRFAPGETTADIPFQVTNDTRDEENETVLLTLQTPIHATIDAARQNDTVVIVDEDAAPAVSFVKATSAASEATTSRAMAVALSQRSGKSVVVYFATQDSTAKSGSDFVSKTDSVEFAPGDSLKNVTVTVVEDALDELSEVFVVKLTGSANATLGAIVRHEATIADNDASPSFAFAGGDHTVWENAGFDSIRVRLPRASGKTLAVDYTTRAITAATDSDFVLTKGTLTFAPGDTSKLIRVAILDDVMDEFNETYAVELRNPVGTTLGGVASVTTTILDNDSASTVWFVKTFQSVSEGVGEVGLLVRLDRPSAKPIAVDFAPTGSASAQDHELTAGVLSFGLGDTLRSIAVRVVEDRLDEPAESLVVSLSNPVNATLIALRSKDTLEIIDNDLPPTASFVSQTDSVREDVGEVSRSLELSAPSAYPIRVGVVARGTATGAQAARPDYSWRNTDTTWVTFAPGSTTASVKFSVVDDGAVEPTESVVLLPVAADWAQPGASDSVYILDNDHNPVVEIVRPVDSSLTNVPKQNVQWTVDGKVQTPWDTTLVEGWNTIGKCVTDTAGNVGCDTVHVRADFTPPSVLITTPKDSSLTNKPDQNVVWRVIDDRDTAIKKDQQKLVEGPNWIIRTACDKAGNCGADTILVTLDTQPPKVTIVTPSDNGHTSDATVPVKWVSIDNGDSTWHLDTTRLVPGSNLVVRCAEDKAGNRGCDSVIVIQDRNLPKDAEYVDSDGDGRIDQAIFTFPRPWTDAPPTFDLAYDPSGTGKQTNLTGVVDSKRIVVSLREPWEMGMTSPSGPKNAVIHSVVDTNDLVNNRTVRATFSDSLTVKDAAAPVVTDAQLRRTEVYDGQDTLVIKPSETLVRDTTGTWLEYRVGKDWVKLPVDSVVVLPDGRLWLLLPGGILKPQDEIRFGTAVRDTLGNRVPSTIKWTEIVQGPPRPLYLEVTPPVTIPKVSNTEVNRNLPSGFALQMSKGNSENGMQWWKPGIGYVNASQYNDVCPETTPCEGVTVVVNRPMELTVYIYDNIGTSAAYMKVNITREDLAMTKTDKLERVQLRMLWNLRGSNNRVVATGVYPWRIVAKATGVQGMSVVNKVVRMGVNVPGR